MKMMEGDGSSMAVTISVERLRVRPNERWVGPVESWSSSSRSGHGNGNYIKPRLVRGVHPEMGIPNHDKFRRRQAKKEILRRALTPPVRRPTLRWLDFRPTPSRLRNMSTE